MEETRWVKHSSPGHSDLSCSGRLGGVVDVLTRSQQRLLFFSPLRSGGNLAQNTGSSVGRPEPCVHIARMVGTMVWSRV